MNFKWIALRVNVSPDTEGVGQHGKALRQTEGNPVPKPAFDLAITKVSPALDLEKRTRRMFFTDYKLKIFAAVEHCVRGELGALLRQVCSALGVNCTTVYADADHRTTPSDFNRGSFFASAGLCDSSRTRLSTPFVIRNQSTMNMQLDGILHTPLSGDQAARISMEAVPPRGLLVSCLMVTRGKLFPSRYAVECFQRQSYPNRELIVVLDDPESGLISYLETLNDDRIRLILLPKEKRTLGALRNISIAHARGEYICQWDDDDLYDPDRIGIQLSALLASKTAACFLWRWTLWRPADRKLGISAARLWEGSMLAHKALVPDYPSIPRGEDTEMVAVLRERECLLSLDAPDLYVYIRHGNNTFDQQHFFQIFHSSRRRWINTEYGEKLSQFSERIPVQNYFKDFLERDTQEPFLPAETGVLSSGPLVSIIVRSMGRPELRLALESLAAQDYPNLEVIVVDASGGTHPPLPEIAWAPGHHMRVAGGERRLNRPQACNVGLDAVQGEWFGFLDDDDTCDPGHVSELIRASGRHPEALLVYGSARLLDDTNEVKRVFGIGFNRAVMSYGPLFYWQAALIHRRAIAAGCRFDERMEVCEDRDFLAQIAEVGDFAFVPAVNFNYRPDLGTSGTGQGSNLDIAKLTRYEGLLQAKWSGSGTYHSERALWYSRRALFALGQHDEAGAESLLRVALKEYPDDPNALNGLGCLLMQRGDLDRAWPLFRRASDINPSAGQYRLNLAVLHEKMGRLSLARQEALSATSDPSVREAALMEARRLGATLRPITPARPAAASGAKLPGRTDPCPCGSGKRYKHCCGELGTSQPQTGPEEMLAGQATAAFQRGEAFLALDMLSELSPALIGSASTALACGQVCYEMGHFEQAYAYYSRAAGLGKAHEVGSTVGRMCLDWYGEESSLSIRKEVTRLVKKFNAGSSCVPADHGPKHIICALGGSGGTEHRALAVYDLLSAHAQVQLWSVDAPPPHYSKRYPIRRIDTAKGLHPGSGHLIFVGAYYDYGLWLDRTSPSRITISVNTRLTDGLVARLAQLEDIPSRHTLDFTFPSRMFRDLTGLSGQIEYPLVDTNRFRPSGFKMHSGRALVIGRHSRDHRTKFHPNDPALFRTLSSQGHRLRIKGGTLLSDALGRDLDDGRIELLPESKDDIVEFLEGLDCYLYRTHPHFIETGGAVILEAMSMGLPVVAFRQRLGVAELIEHGVNGFLVETEEEALRCVKELADSPGLRHDVGMAARAMVTLTMSSQASAALKYYLQGVGTEVVPALAVR